MLGNKSKQFRVQKVYRSKTILANKYINVYNLYNLSKGRYYRTVTLSMKRKETLGLARRSFESLLFVLQRILVLKQVFEISSWSAASSFGLD